MDFKTYWDTIGSRLLVESHEERARLAWEAGQANRCFGIHPNLYGLSFKAEHNWENEGGSCVKEVEK